MKVDLKRITARFYRSSTKKEPVREWLLEMKDEDRKTIGIDIKTIEYGWPIGMPGCRSLGRGLYEVRSNLSDGIISRVIFCIEGDIMVLLHGFIKKKQKTPDKEIELALKRKREVMENER